MQRLACEREAAEGEREGLRGHVTALRSKIVLLRLDLLQAPDGPDAARFLRSSQSSQAVTVAPSS